MIMESVFEVYVTNVFPWQEYYIYGDKTTYGKYVVCVGRRLDPNFKAVLLQFDNAEDLVIFLRSIDVPHSILMDPKRHGILSNDGNLYADLADLEDMINA